MNSPYPPRMGPYPWQTPAWAAPGPTSWAAHPFPAPHGFGPYYQQPPQPPARAQAGSLLGNPRFIRGALVGAAVTYLLTNEQVQQTAIHGAVRAWSLVRGGVEEMKERFRDAEAELHAAQVDSAD